MIKIKTLNSDENLFINTDSANLSLRESRPSAKNKFYNYKFSYGEVEVMDSLLSGVLSNDNRYKPSVVGELLYAWLGLFDNSFYIFTTYGGIVEAKLFLYDDSINEKGFIEFKQIIKGVLEIPVSYDIDGINLFGDTILHDETKRLIMINEHAVRNLKYCTKDIIDYEKSKFDDLKKSYNLLMEKYEDIILEKKNIKDLTYTVNNTLTRKKKKEVDLINNSIGEISSIVQLLNDSIKKLNDLSINNAMEIIDKSINDSINGLKSISSKIKTL